MRAIIALPLFIILFSSMTYAQNLDVQLYQEYNGAKNFGNIKAKPGDSITAFIEVENENSDRSDSDQDIEDIAVTITVEGILLGEDFEEEFDDFDLRATRTEDLEVKFNVPLRIEDGDHDIIIEYDGTENGVDFSDSVDYYLTVEKEKHDLRINRFEFTPTHIECNQVSNLNIDILNLGSSNEKVDVTIENKQMEYISRKSVELQSYPGVDEYITTFPIKFPENEDTYTFDLKLEYSNLIMNKETTLDVDCSPTTEIVTTTTPETKRIETESQEIVPLPKPIQNPQIIVDHQSNTPLIILGILLLSVVILIIVILSLKRK